MFQGTLSDCGQLGPHPSSTEGSTGTAVVERVMTRSFAARMERVKKQEQARKPLTGDELKQLLEAKGKKTA